MLHYKRFIKFHFGWYCSYWFVQMAYIMFLSTPYFLGCVDPKVIGYMQYNGAQYRLEDNVYN